MHVAVSPRATEIVIAGGLFTPHRHQAGAEMKNLVFAVHVKSGDGVQLLGDEEDPTRLRRLGTIVPRDGTRQG